MPQLYVISGCNGAGKTTASYALLPEMLGCSQFVNSDEFAKSLSPFSPDAASIQAGKLMLLKMNYLFRRHEDFAIETTLATRSLKRMIDRAHEQGYTVTILYFWLNSPELAVERVRARVAAGGHNIPEPVIRRRYTAGLHYFSMSISQWLTGGYWPTTPRYRSASSQKDRKTDLSSKTKKHI